MKTGRLVSDFNLVENCCQLFDFFVYAIYPTVNAPTSKYNNGFSWNMMKLENDR